VACNLPGRYVIIWRPITNPYYLYLGGVAMSVDCNKLPWDEVIVKDLYKLG